MKNEGISYMQPTYEDGIYRTIKWLGIYIS